MATPSADDSKTKSNTLETIPENEESTVISEPKEKEISITCSSVAKDAIMRINGYYLHKVGQAQNLVIEFEKGKEDEKEKKNVFVKLDTLLMHAAAWGVHSVVNSNDQDVCSGLIQYIKYLEFAHQALERSLKLHTIQQSMEKN